MKYDRTDFRVQPGDVVQLTFRNDDPMPHNLVICLPRAFCTPGEPVEDNGLEVAKAGWDLGADAPARHWVPKHPRVIVATKMLAGDTAETLQFTAPTQPGRYPYVCTYPGHATMMFGLMHVQPATPVLQTLRFRLRRGTFDAPPDFSQPAENPGDDGALADGLIDASVGGTNKNFAVEFDGILPVEKSGRYSFHLAGDNEPELMVDNLQVAGRASPAVPGRPIPLELGAGAHRIILRYRYQWERKKPQPEVTLLWSGADFTEAPLSRVDLIGRQRHAQAELDIGMPLQPENGEPVFYRNFIADMRSGFAVGYPAGANLTWDPATMNVGQVWRGAFLDVKRHRTRSGAGAIQPLGFAVARPARGVPLARLDRTDSKWPADKAVGIEYQFLGYSFDSQRRPSFRYRFGEIMVTDTFSAEGSVPAGTLRLVRTLRLHATAASSANRPLFFRGVAAPDVTSDTDGVQLANEVRVTTQHPGAWLRSSGENKEWLVPVQMETGDDTLEIVYSWRAHAHAN